DAGIVHVAENGRDLAARRLPCCALARDVHRHHLSGFGPGRPVARDEDVVDGATLERNDVGLAGPVALESSDRVLKFRPRVGLTAAGAREGVEMSANAHEGSGGDKRVQLALERRTLQPGNTEESYQLLRACGMRYALAYQLKKIGLAH